VVSPSRALDTHALKLTGVGVPNETERLAFVALRRDAVSLVAPALAEEGEVPDASSYTTDLGERLTRSANHAAPRPGLAVYCDRRIVCATDGTPFWFRMNNWYGPGGAIRPDAGGVTVRLCPSAATWYTRVLSRWPMSNA